MVLTRIASNYVSKRNAENMPPHKNLSTFIKRQTSTAARRRRDRYTGTRHRKRRAVEDAIRKQVYASGSSTTASSSTTSLERLVTSSASHWDVSEAMEEDRREPQSTVMWLPRRLPRPEGREINPASLAAIDPGLVEVPLQYIIDGLTITGPSMLDVLASTSIVGVDGARAPNGLFKAVHINVTNPCADLPTHMLAIYPKPDPSVPSSSKQTLQFVPAHSLMLAVHCTNLPTLPPSSSPTPKPESSKKPIRATVPVIPIALPAPHMYARLSAYLYTKRAEELLEALVRIPSDSLTNLLHHTPPNTSHQAQRQYKNICRSIAAKLSQTCPSERIVQDLADVTGLWKNTCALGIYDTKLWGVMEFAWNILTMAFAMRPGQVQVE